MYTIGDVVEVEAMKIKDFGVFTRCDDKKTDGLLHISKITTGRVKNIEKYVRIKDRFQAKIIGIDQIGRLELSTVGLDMPEYDVPEHDASFERETEELFAYIKNYTGYVSHQAKEDFKTLIDHYGLFQVTLKLAQKLTTFQTDLSVILANQMKHELIDDLSKIDVSCTRHASEQYLDRVGDENLEKAEESVKRLVKTGVRVETLDKEHIYIKNEKLVFPCLYEDKKLVVKTVLTEGMHIKTA